MGSRCDQWWGVAWRTNEIERRTTRRHETSPNRKWTFGLQVPVLFYQCVDSVGIVGKTNLFAKRTAPPRVQVRNPMYVCRRLDFLSKTPFSTILNSFQEFLCASRSWKSGIRKLQGSGAWPAVVFFIRTIHTPPVDSTQATSKPGRRTCRMTRVPPTGHASRWFCLFTDDEWEKHSSHNFLNHFLAHKILLGNHDLRHT